jgi:hypothetical protein
MEKSLVFLTRKLVTRQLLFLFVIIIKLTQFNLAFNLLARGGGKCSMPMLPGNGVSPQNISL